MKNRGITFKLIVAILTSSLLIFLIIFTYNYFVSRRILINEIEKNAKDLALVTVNKIETILKSVEKVPANLAYFLKHSSYNKEELLLLLRSIVENNPEIYGATIAFEPYAFKKDLLYFAPYFYKKDGTVKFTYLGDETYRYFLWDWYQIPKELNAPAWSEPYYDEGGGNIIMSTYSVPFYKIANRKKKFMGIVTADISMTWLQKIVSSIKIAESGYAFLISQNGTVVTHPKKDLIMNETIFSIGEGRNDDSLRTIGKKMTRGKSGFVPFESIITGDKCWMVFEPISSTGWSLGVLFPKKELMTDVTNLSRIVLVIGIIGFFVLLIVIIWISRSITRPLRVLVETTKDIAKGHLDFKLPRITTHDEVGTLSQSFVYMRDSLKQYIKDLTETTKAKQRMESELQLAHDIQMSILPKKFPPFPDKKECDVFAVLEPAREVGGDLFDFFFIGDTHLCFIVGDVSGKGVPAALMMTETKMLFKALGHELGSPEAIMTRVNREISANNEACLFVTAFCGVLDIITGEVQFANAGHNPPLLIRGKNGLSFLPHATNTVIGVSTTFTYNKHSLVLQPGDTILVYTDGVTEAFNKSKQLFSEKRLQKDAENLKMKPLRELVQGILQNVKTFSHGIPQSDDITILAVKYFGT